MATTTIPKPASVGTIDALLTEVQRQEKYLSELPENFEFPLFNSARAVESQRQSGYRTTASAAREIVDNAIEAGAKRVHIVYDYPAERKNKQRRDAVSAVAFIDDGSGMLPRMARYALSWGGGTHFDDPEFIGRFGFGLPNASINQTRRVEVYTRVKGAKRFTKAWLDINSVAGYAVQQIPEPVEAELPVFVQRYLERESWKLDHGTVVVWDKPDRLSRRTGASLKEHLVDDFAVTYRYLLKGRELKVDGVVVKPVDPLFLDPDSMYHVAPIEGAVDQGGAQMTVELTIPVKYVIDPETGGKHLHRVLAPEDLEDQTIVQQGLVHLRVARLPLGFAVSKDRAKEIRPMDEHSFARFEIRKPRRGMSFVRAGREIETVDVFPHRLREVNSGMGVWPLLQGYAYHWGVEVRFDPKLDDVFGIANDKQTVRPIEDFWRVLAEAGVDKLLRRENSWQSKRRSEEEKALRAATLEENRETASPAEMAAQAGDVALGTKPRVPESKRQGAGEARDRRAEEEAKEQQKSKVEVLAALAEQDKKRPYRVEYVDAEDGFVYVPDWDATQIVVRVNKRHPLFQVLYGSLLHAPGGGLAKQAVDLLLIALAKGELSDNEETAEIYKVQRETLWSPFLATAMRDLERRYSTSGVEEEVERNDTGEVESNDTATEVAA
jgi:hypothetical protein